MRKTLPALALLLAVGACALDLAAASRSFSARLVRVVDGDTVRLDIDLGADVILKNQAVRIRGIDAPELHGLERPRGLAAKRAAEEFLRGKKLHVELHGKEKYGRWLGDLRAEGGDFGDWMVRNGQARIYRAARGASTRLSHPPGLKVN